jgi:serine/threonine protein kinase
MAEQSQPIRRKVALKVLKPGMDTHQVVARFEAERQALALMDHPNIARVFDGGATPSGRPYFVMELVKGLPITQFCDQNQLMPRQRLELFVSVCQAVQYAHTKGIIHRDIKPSNVLVTVQDTTPVVKVIDFGVAKALGQELTDRTLFTGFAQMIGTQQWSELFAQEEDGRREADLKVVEAPALDAAVGQNSDGNVRRRRVVLGGLFEDVLEPVVGQEEAEMVVVARTHLRGEPAEGHRQGVHAFFSVKTLLSTSSTPCRSSCRLAYSSSGMVSMSMLRMSPSLP